MRVIGFSGKMGSGKDYTANEIKNLLLEQDSSLKLASLTFASALRDEVNEIVADYKFGNETSSTLALAYDVTEAEMKKLISLLIRDDNFSSEGYSLYNRTTFSREILQYWGTDVRRNQSSEYWIDKTNEKIRNLNSDYVFITDVRFPNEYKLIKKWSGKVVRCEVPITIQRERLKLRDGISNQKNENFSHSSESSLDYHIFDLTIDTSKPDSALKAYNAIAIKRT